MKISILGAGESGLGAACLAKAEGLDVLLSDTGTIDADSRQFLTDQGIPFESGQHTWELISESDEVVKSPGIPDSAPLVVRLRNAGIPVISDIELAGRYTSARIVAITGSNGKTTTTRLTHHLLASAGLSVSIGGNVGVSFARNVLDGPYDYHVLELSSFQLDGIDRFRPHIAVLLNITPDHLDRYDYQMERYVRSKFRIGMNQQEGDLLVYNADDANIRRFLAQVPQRQRCLPVPGRYTGKDWLEVGPVGDQGPGRFDMRRCALKGQHNFLNAACAIQVARELGVAASVIQSALDTFVNDPHRMEKLAVSGDVTWVNDSKATNVDSVFYALQAMETPVVWLAGGTDKGNDYSPLFDLARQKVRTLICIGVDNRKLAEAFRPHLPDIREAESAAEAVRLAKDAAQPGDTVLLSPACASFDRFRNYMDRGEQFKTAVRQLLR
ncbi:MAG: hypothetical protein RLY31_2771 [Bacteroidota bacterium]|jgi:UDP-N-acetylmuramoylalanine--D-glutamate ligase